MNLHQEAGEALAVKTAAIIQNGGTAAAGVAAGVRFLGFTQDQWTVVGIAGGLAIALLGLLARVALDWYFRQQHLKLAREKAFEWSPLSDE